MIQLERQIDLRHSQLDSFTTWARRPSITSCSRADFPLIFCTGPVPAQQLDGHDKTSRILGAWTAREPLLRAYESCTGVTALMYPQPAKLRTEWNLEERNAL